jgi:hypothetical protein
MAMQRSALIQLDAYVRSMYAKYVGVNVPLNCEKRGFDDDIKMRRKKRRRRRRKRRRRR